jgi:2-polyprenyl-3-methyl-5-hydroxy-6-metoxy-1,4-benzoquinol methylase
MTLVTVPCAVCLGATFQAVYPATIEDCDTAPWQYFGSSRARAGHLPIVRCSACGLLMTNPQDDLVTLAAGYRQHADAVYDLEYENRRHAAQTHLGLVMTYSGPPARLLDVGCGTGAFVSVAQNAGWEAIGLDASEWMIVRARARCPRATFQVGFLEEAQWSSEAFEVITLWDVLEHVPSPLAALRRLRMWLTPTGVLCLSVPNAGSVIARLMGPRWVLLLREHLWYFCAATMARVLSQAGFMVVEMRPKMVQYSLANILRRLGQYSGALPSLARRLSGVPGFSRLRLRLPMGEMDVVARVK